jgi:hypothetical protein
MSKLDKLFKAHDLDVVDKEAPILKETKGVLMCITGKKRTGKTSLIVSFLSSPKLYKGYYHNIFMISPSHSDGKTKQLIAELDKEGKFYKELTESNLQKICDYIEHEQMQIENARAKGKIPKEKQFYNLLILDDVITSIPRSFKKNIITSLFYNQRHFNLSIMVISQSYKLLNPNVRKNIDMLYTFPMTNLKEREAIQDDWSIPDEVFDYCFEDDSDHPFLTVNLSGNKPVYFRKMTKINI